MNVSQPLGFKQISSSKQKTFQVEDMLREPFKATPLLLSTYFGVSFWLKYILATKHIDEHFQKWPLILVA